MLTNGGVVWFSCWFFFSYRFLFFCWFFSNLIIMKKFSFYYHHSSFTTITTTTTTVLPAMSLTSMSPCAALLFDFSPFLVFWFLLHHQSLLTPTPVMAPQFHLHAIPPPLVVTSTKLVMTHYGKNINTHSQNDYASFCQLPCSELLPVSLSESTNLSSPRAVPRALTN